MKINKLTIHNIASIEDATIDFNQKPLNDADLFLITGTTGSGKTTILDAICLALYNTTPRLEKGTSGKENANRDNLTGKDPRNLMRSNTGHAYTQLNFTGNDGREYVAEWSVQRGTRQNPEQNLNNAVWSITEVAGGKRIEGDKRDGYNEVGAAIYAAVGLDFNQFCRTTMLAQGEFTEFLKSDEDQKAAILEKISGSEIYRKIGKEIYNQYIEAKRRFEEERRLHEAIDVMDPQERQEKEDKIAELSAKLAVEQAKLDELVVMIDWMNDKATADAHVEKMKGELEKSAGDVDNEEFAAEQAVLAEWTETAEARDSYRSALAEMGRKNAAAASLAGLKDEFVRTLGGEAYMLAQKQKVAAEKAAAEAAVDAEAANADAYRMSQTICGNITNVMEKQADILEAQRELEKCRTASLPEAVKKAEEAGKFAMECQGRVDAAKKSLETAEQALANINLPALRAHKDVLADVERFKQNIEESQAKAGKARQAVDELKAALPQVEKAAAEENEVLKQLKEKHDMQHQSMEKATLKMRSMLQERLGKEDNACPVCGQLVTSIKADEVFAEEYNKIKAEFNTQEEKASAADKALMELNSRIASEERVLNGLESELERYVRGLEQVKVDETVKAASKEEISAMIEAAKTKIAEGEAVEAERTALQNRHADLLKEQAKTKAHAVADAGAVSLIEQKIKTLEASIAEDSEDVQKLEESIASGLAGTLEWAHDWKAEPKEFMVEIKEKAGRYESMVAAVAAAEARIVGIDPVLSNIASIKADIVSAMPEWNGVAADSGVQADCSGSPVSPVQVPGLQDAWVRLGNGVQAHRQALTTAEANYAAAMAVVEKFLADCPAYTLEKLEALNRITLAEKEVRARKIVDLLGKKATAAAQYQTAMEQMDALMAKKPAAIAEETTVEDLVQQKADLVGERDKIGEERGRFMQEIAADDEAQAKKGDTTLLDQLAAEHDKWKSFSSHYGDRDGDTLNRIAQSFVLGSLLKTANEHLKGMAPRYKLLVNPGTLTLKLEDQRNCYATRNTNSISGGESFLVSLALALALADFGQHLGVSTLFIDEGFGTLSGEALQSAINTLKAIHSDAGRQVGIISHREEIRENIPVQVHVTTQPGTSTSTISVTNT